MYKIIRHHIVEEHYDFPVMSDNEQNRHFVVIPNNSLMTTGFGIGSYYKEKHVSRQKIL